MQWVSWKACNGIDRYGVFFKGGADVFSQELEAVCVNIQCLIS